MDTTGEAKERQQRLESILADFLQAAEAGRAPDQRELLARHPELADELASFFANRAEFVKLAGPVAPLAEGPTLGLDAPPTAGATVRYFGDYEILEEIARGGMGVVFKARQLSLNRVVAIKMILTGQLATDADVQRFRHEAEAAANLDHPHIVPIYEVGEYHGNHYFAMKLIDGGNLAGHLDELRRDRKVGVRLMAKTARAVHYAHQRGILHRDLKPANILLDQAGEPHVTDFGLAKRVTGDSGLTQSGAIVGTPSYMAPEQAAARKDLTTAVDVCSLGAILYELLTGRPPFRGATPLETLLQVLDREPPPPRSLDATIDRDLETIAFKCLAKNPAGRYASAEALAEDLERFLRGEPIQARPTRVWEAAVKWARRRPTAAALAAVSVLAALALVGLAVGLWYNGRLQTALDDARTARETADQQRQRAESLEASVRYARTLTMAYQTHRDGQPARALEMLASCRPAGTEAPWEWRYVERQCRNELFLVPAHHAAVGDLVVSPDGRRVVSVAFDGTVEIHDAWGGRFLSHWTAPGGPWYRIALSADGKRLVGISQTAEERSLKVWDVADGRERLALTGKRPFGEAVALSADGAWCAVADGDTIEVRAVDGGRDVRTLRGHTKQVSCVAFSADGKRLASGENVVSDASGVKVWDLGTGQELRTFATPMQFAYGLAFSQDGRRLALVSIDMTALIALRPGAVKVWDVDTGREEVSIKGTGDLLFQPAFSPDGRYLVLASEEPVARVLDATTGREEFNLRGHPHGVGRVTFSPDGGRLFTAGARPSAAEDDGADGELAAWDVIRSRESVAVAPTGGFAVVAFSPDGLWLARADTLGNTVTVTDALTGQVRHKLRCPRSVASLAYSPDGRRLAAGTGEFLHLEWAGDKKLPVPGRVQVWDTATGKERFALDGPAEQVSSVAYSPDGRYVAAGDVAGGVRLWDATTGAALHTPAAAGESIQTVAFSPGGQLAVAAGNTVRLFDPTSGRLERTLPFTHPVCSLCFSADGSRLAVVADHYWQRDSLGKGQGAGPPGVAVIYDIRCAAWSGSGCKGRRSAGRGGDLRRRRRQRTPDVARPSESGVAGGVQPGRSPAGDRWRRRHAAAMGRRQRIGTAHPARP